MKDSIEAKFAQTLNRIVTSENKPEEPPNTLLAKLGAHIGRKTQEKVGKEVRSVYKQLKVLELKSKAVVQREDSDIEEEQHTTDEIHPKGGAMEKRRYKEMIDSDPLSVIFNKSNRAMDVHKLDFLKLSYKQSIDKMTQDLLN